jgi:hypothetical protein
LEDLSECSRSETRFPYLAGLGAPCRNLLLPRRAQEFPALKNAGGARGPEYRPQDPPSLCSPRRSCGGFQPPEREDFPAESLQRAHIIAIWPPIYFGKESDRHWEEGDDLSLLDFKAVQYTRKGKAIANDEQFARIASVPKRELMRRGVNQHTLEKICKQIPVQANKFAKCLRVLEEYAQEKQAR